MTTTQTAPATLERRMRLVIEGNGHEVDPGQKTIRLTTDDGASILVNKEWAGVTVEDLAPAYVWTDGDVVQVVATDEVLRRRRIEGNTSKWFRGIDLTIFARTDSAITEAVRNGRVRVLRCQAGEK